MNKGLRLGLARHEAILLGVRSGSLMNKGLRPILVLYDALDRTRFAVAP